MKWGYRKVTGSPQCHSRDVARGAIAAAGREESSAFLTTAKTARGCHACHSGHSRTVCRV